MSGDDFFSDDDLETWQYVASTVTPLDNKKAPSKADKKEIKIAPRQTYIGDTPDKKIKSLAHLTHGDTSGTDKSTAKKLREGKYPIEAKLDMHGRTQDEALEGLRYFIGMSYEMGKRCVLVITGKGAPGGGVLQTQTARWLNNPGLREYIVSFSYAQPKHGGEGALYILLKRKK